VILSGDHIYKMDYAAMVERHKEANAACTISVMEVPWDEASRFGIMAVDGEDMITEFAEKPKEPKSNLASMGIYVFSWQALRKYLTEDEADPNSENDFGKNVIPAMLNNGERMAAYRFEGYWKDVGTLTSLWDANMDMLSPESGLDLVDESWPIYARSVNAPPTYMGVNSKVTHSALNRGSVLEGTVENSVLSPNIVVGEGARVSYSVLLPGTVVEAGAVVEYAILGENCHIGKDCKIGGTPEESGEGWGLTVLAPECKVEDGRQVAAGVMLGRNGEEVSK
jgi:glucose-1-phosphate adenylyltransferase